MHVLGQAKLLWIFAQMQQQRAKYAPESTEVVNKDITHTALQSIQYW